VINTHKNGFAAIGYQSLEVKFKDIPIEESTNFLSILDHIGTPTRIQSLHTIHILLHF
jgi:hypothetical protein